MIKFNIYPKFLAKRTIPIPKTQEWLNAIFADLKTHYDNSFNDITRFGQLMLCIEAIEVSFMVIENLNPRKKHRHSHFLYKNHHHIDF